MTTCPRAMTAISRASGSGSNTKTGSTSRLRQRRIRDRGNGRTVPAVSTRRRETDQGGSANQRSRFVIERRTERRRNSSVALFLCVQPAVGRSRRRGGLRARGVDDGARERRGVPLQRGALRLEERGGEGGMRRQLHRPDRAVWIASRDAHPVALQL